MALRTGGFPATLASSDGFAVVAELVPWRDSADSDRGALALAIGDALAGHPRITALSITDGAGGHPAVAPLMVAQRYADRAREVIVHVACRDRSRRALQELGWTLVNQGLTNVLALSGDSPAERAGGLSRPVFDLDSTGLLSMYAGLDPTRSFFLGAVVNSHKRHERELLPQYHKLELKIRSGARFIVSQLGYDARKSDELIRYMRHRGLTTPVLANVFILSDTVARRFHAGRVPGCVVTDDLLALVERRAAAPDRGRAFFLTLAAQQIAIARGLGYRGVWISGHRTAAEVTMVLELADRFGPDDWRGFAGAIRFGWPDGFYYFELDPATGLNRDTVNPAYLASCTIAARRSARGTVSSGYRCSRLLHALVFAPEAPGFPLGAAVYRGAEGTGLDRPLHLLEQAIKGPWFDCRDCGDCSLAELAYLCPASHCPKGQRNGPCGGSRDGQCEVGDRACIWARAYERLKPYGEEADILSRPLTIADPALLHTSAWANTFLRRDHLARLTPRERTP
ncbi:MAG: methylenetetrahydrofolate reductase C-terminal domain-containing protein [Gemmatimonadota bacterium]|nr:methylenetetrahydrofolate reductase C-terminal domain-containing protein [Gemmatimonadota bacterium]